MPCSTARFSFISLAEIFPRKRQQSKPARQQEHRAYQEDESDGRPRESNVYGVNLCDHVSNLYKLLHPFRDTLIYLTHFDPFFAFTFLTFPLSKFKYVPTHF